MLLVGLRLSACGSSGLTLFTSRIMSGGLTKHLEAKFGVGNKFVLCIVKYYIIKIGFSENTWFEKPVTYTIKNGYNMLGHLSDHVSRHIGLVIHSISQKNTLVRIGISKGNV